ncbi:Tetratricopeptide TPR_1 repeat-containing protein [Paludibacter propionicigenes WB4]|uniref:Tetratricopeptide TPR_1 repeat-containing protein n=1 Tax=Paludibacter propionicigenes (strain DSM 17365 / JCM 13257 / WB4) TaxID=694427 RepID=E4T5Q0_PALPW|nr:tetratricopeptide repeat protein [Paludibacter propionicigenes]ADQ80044.1 Tetratricopeptide TPR_1 repeat-containing protein [Paludibacter propionicigenes WB4]
MNLRYYNIISLLCLLLASCSSTPDELKIAEHLIESRPDSALTILQTIRPQNLELDSHIALYCLLINKALSKTDKYPASDSTINTSINYYKKNNEKERLIECYFYRGKLFMHLKKYDEATNMFLKALDNKSATKHDKLWAELYHNLGNICYIQHEYLNAREKYIQSAEYYNKANTVLESNYRLLDIGRTYFSEKKYNTALFYYSKVLGQSKDSFQTGKALQEIGINYLHSGKIDSAQKYLTRCLHYPGKAEDKGLQFMSLADMYLKCSQFDSAFHYSALALKEPTDLLTKRECYRILVDIEFHKKNLIQMGKYMTLFQSYSNFVKALESQTKSTVIENLHDTNEIEKGTKRNTIIILSILFIVLSLSGIIVYLLFKRNKAKKTQLKLFRDQLSTKQEFVSRNLSRRIQTAKETQTDHRRNASSEERVKLDKELYNKTLQLEKWDDFKVEMNHTFNQIIDKLELNFSGITQREMIWCCLHLLEVPNTDKMLILDASPDSLYKLKQRLAKKLNLKTTKQLDSFLIEIISA